ncbi:MAG: hypothetical protein N2441_09735 [Rhodocyclaceae bacterium]|nr:hypothetical protein [Rhodocyclaceae bacterium]
MSVRWLPAKWLAVQRRERDRILAELSEIKGLLPLLMRQRNGGRWSASERAQLRRTLAALASLSPYLALLALPGSVVLLPLYAWWLDRRRKPRFTSPDTDT